MGNKKRSLKSKQFRSRQNSITSLQSSLNILENSQQDSIDAIDNPCNMEKRVTYDALKKSNKQSSVNLCGKNSSLQDSVIVINDSDNEANDGNKTDSSLSIIEYIPSTGTTTTTPRSSVVNIRKNTLRSSRKQKRSPLSLVDENASLQATDDDVIELWSHLGSSSKAEKNICKPPKKKWKADNNFEVDRKINPKFTMHLNFHTKPIRMKREGGYNPKKAMLFDKPTIAETSKFVRKAKQRSMKMKSCLKHSNAGPSKCQIKIEDNKKSKNEKLPNSKHRLREIIVDGCNIAMLHANGKAFSEKGIALVINYFESRGHTVKVFLPQHVRERNYQLLEKWYSKGTVVFTPSRYIAGRRITSYEDRYILEYATKCNGIVISSDQYRDLYKEKPEWRNTILNRLLIPTFVDDYIMFPEDPLGKSGPNLETFLRH